jgi:hypothetical protein
MAETQEVSTDQPGEGDEKTTGPDLSSITTALNAEFDKRFQGLQSLLDRRTSEFQQRLEDLKTADLTPEEQEQVREREHAKKMAALERENQLLKMRKNFPEEVDLLEQFFSADSLESQLDLLSKFRKAQAEAEAQGAEAAGQPTPVDKNNPPRKQELSLADMAERMSGDLADKILGQSSEKGLLRKLRGG